MKHNLLKRHKTLNIFAIVGGLTLLLAYLSPYFLSGDNPIVYVHDNLDAAIPFYKILAENGWTFSAMNTTIEPVMGGMPRACFPSGLNITHLLYLFFKPVTAYILNILLIHLLAFAGMFLLLKNFVFHKQKTGEVFLCTGLAVAFALLPFWPSGGLSVAGQPFVFYAFLKIKNKQSSLVPWLIVLLYPFFSSLVLSGIFILISCIGLFIFDTLKSGRMNKTWGAALALLSVMYLLAEYQLALWLLDPQFVSHRSQFVANSWNLKQLYDAGWKMLFFGQYHAHSFHTGFILPVAVLAPFVMLTPEKIRKGLFFSIFGVLSIVFILNFVGVFDWYNFFKDDLLKQYPSLFVATMVASAALLFLKNHYREAVIITLILCISFFYGFWKSEFMDALKINFKLLGQFQFDRFYFMLPLLWFVYAAVLLRKFMLFKTPGFIFLTIILFSQVIFSFQERVAEQWRNPQPFSEYFSTPLYEDVKSYIALPVNKYRVASIGLDPAIALYNGFHTIDGYLANYPVNYKHDFRKIIVGELEKDIKLKKSFDEWGSRCYIFVSEIENDSLPNISIDVNQMKIMGVKFVLSKYIIGNHEALRLELLKHFEHDNEKEKVYLYELVQRQIDYLRVPKQNRDDR